MSEVTDVMGMTRAQLLVFLLGAGLVLWLAACALSVAWAAVKAANEKERTR